MKCYGVSRVSVNPQALLVSFSQRLTDEQLRFFHEVCNRTAPLLPEDEESNLHLVPKVQP